jgi:Flp pilus assembly protein TadD
MRIFWPMTLALALSSTAGCASKKSPATEEPDPNAPPDPEDFRPAEEEASATPAPVDPYAGMSEDERLDKAKGLYLEAEGLAKAKDWEAAEAKYEEAYYLVPGKHGFAFKVGKSAFEAGHCEKAEQYLTHFQTYGDPKKQSDLMKEAKQILAKTAGCGG